MHSKDKMASVDICIVYLWDVYYLGNRNKKSAQSSGKGSLIGTAVKRTEVALRRTEPSACNRQQFVTVCSVQWYSLPDPGCRIRCHSLCRTQSSAPGLRWLFISRLFTSFVATYHWDLYTCHPHRTQSTGPNESQVVRRTARLSCCFCCCCMHNNKCSSLD
jgi:hypothetical protein